MITPSRSRTWMINIGVLVSALSLCFIVVEIGIRIAYGNPHVFRSPQVRHIPTPYGYKPEPSQTNSYTLDRLVTVNSSGFRDTNEWATPKPKGSYRVMIIGDSFTFGNGVDTEERFSDLLRRDLQTRHAQIEVLNCSAGGWNLNNEVAFFRTEALDYEPDALILAFFPNDWMTPPPTGLSDPPPSSNLSPEGRWDARPPWLRWLPYEVIFKLKYAATVMFFRDRLAVLGSDPEFLTLLMQDQVELDGHPAISYSYQKIEEMKRICSGQEIPMVIAMIPPVNFFWLSDGAPKYIQHFREFAESIDVGFIDLSPGLRMDPGSSPYYNYPWDNHLNAAGHKRVARQLLPVLDRLYTESIDP